MKVKILSKIPETFDHIHPEQKIKAEAMVNKRLIDLFCKKPEVKLKAVKTFFNNLPIKIKENASEKINGISEKEYLVTKIGNHEITPKMIYGLIDLPITEYFISFFKLEKMTATKFENFSNGASLSLNEEVMFAKLCFEINKEPKKVINILSGISDKDFYDLYEDSF